ncbi:LysM domain-containing protein [Xylariales sp. AK1849]|nr:LysM domain-containing protein [Xylariales sp. AK1849]
MSDLARTSSNNNAPSMSSTGLMPAGVDAESTARPRNRRAGASATTNTDRNTSASRLSPGISTNPSRSISPMPSSRLSSTRLATSGRSSPINPSFGKGLLEGSWAPSWTSVQDFASSLLSGGESGYNSDASRPNSRNGSKPRQKTTWKGIGGGGGNSGSSRKLPDSWGPAPPSKSTRPKAEDIAAGSLAERESALRVMKTASVLESYAGVNGGLDVVGKYKRRNSDENLPNASEPIDEEQLAYLHHVQPNDTYAGVVLRYRCQEHAFRKANGLWSRDSIQVRKYLMVPVDACEVKGRLCDPPNFYNHQKVDLLATTPQPEQFIQSGASESIETQTLHDDFFGSQHGRSQSLPEEEQPWTHVRWVKTDASQNPVEIVRVSRKAMGFFPPRRKKSIHTVSAFSTPRQSLDLSRGMTAVSSEPALDSPGDMSTRRQSSLSGRPTVGSLGSSSVTRSRGSSVGQNDNMPAWMRRPGGVGSMSRSVKAPGPSKDYLNTWVNKRLPKGFNIDSMPSMSVMGSESANWGFTSKADEDVPSGIVESPFEDGRDATLVNNKQGIGLEQAAATVETWLRGAWAKRPTTPRLSSTSRKPAQDLDLIELTDTNSDDGRPRTPLRMPEANSLNPGYFGASSGRNDGDGFVRGRSTGPKGRKAD